MQQPWFKQQPLVQSKILFLLLFILVLCSGCSLVKPNATKSGKNYFETFYVGADGNQYFIKPLSLKNSETKEELLVDITFRYKDQIKDSSTINFSIKSPNLYKSVDSLKISSTAIDIKTSNPKLLFNERSKEKFISRFTTKIPLSTLKEMFYHDDWVFTVYHPTQSTVYKTNKKTSKVIATLRKRVFVLM